VASGPREDVPSALADPDDPVFGEPLVDVDELMSGGPPPDGIPSIDEPVWVLADSVDWLDGREPVIFINLNGQARAYPVQIMTWHELVNDVAADTPITMSYCPLCNSAIAYDRRARGRVLEFGTSGMLYQSAMVMYDRQTESLWSHFTGQAIAGHLVGTELDFIPSSMISWDQFRSDHDGGLVLSKQTGHSRNYGRNPYPGYDDVQTSPFLFRGPTDGRLLAKTRVIGIRGKTDSLAIPLENLAQHGVLHVTLDNERVVVFHTGGLASALDGAEVAEGRDVGQTMVLRAEIGGDPLTFRKTLKGWEDQGGTTWSFLGRAVAGPQSGEQLQPLEHLDTFWFASCRRRGSSTHLTSVRLKAGAACASLSLVGGASEEIAAAIRVGYRSYRLGNRWPGAIA